MYVSVGPPHGSVVPMLKWACLLFFHSIWKLSFPDTVSRRLTVALYVTHVLMLVHMSTINKQMRARPGGREAQLAHLWQDRGQEDESGEGRWGTTACLSSSPNLVFFRSGRIRTRAHMLSSLTPDPQRLISVSDKVEQQVHSALHNKSISRVIEFHQSPLPLLRPAGVSPSSTAKASPLGLYNCYYSITLFSSQLKDHDIIIT